jgi:hypothetical protein
MSRDATIAYAKESPGKHESWGFFAFKGLTPSPHSAYNIRIG